MDEHSKNPKFGTDLFVLEVAPLDFFHWLTHVIEPLADKLGLLSVQWSVDLGPSNTYGVIEISTLGKGAHWRTILADIDVMPMGDGLCIIELKGIEGRDYAELLDWIMSVIEAEWPNAMADRNRRRIKQEQEYKSPTPLSDLRATAPTSRKLADDYRELDKLDAVYKRNLKNEGGHPPLAANDWAYAELARRPHDRNKVFQIWREKYIEEVGPEVADLRDLRDTFNAAMRYRRQREEKGDKSA